MSESIFSQVFNIENDAYNSKPHNIKLAYKYGNKDARHVISDLIRENNIERTIVSVHGVLAPDNVVESYSDEEEQAAYLAGFHHVKKRALEILNNN